MFNALSGMGGGGQVDPTAANNANTALYTTFAVFGILGGGIYNILGPKLTLLAGCSTYVLYAGSFLYYNHYHHQAFAIVAGAFLGIGAGLLWASQGAIMTSYPPHDRKGIYISLFWSIFNMGGVIGGLIPFVLNFHRNEAVSVNDGTYIGFMIFMSIGTILSLSILHPSRVVRDDGSRTRGLNNIFYWGAQMIGSILIGYIMDFSFKSRRVRGLFGIGVVAVVGTAIWGGGLVKQLDYSRHDLPTQKVDFKDGTDFAGPFVLYFSYGLLDAMFQSMVYWVIGALADDSEILSRYSGFYKGVQSAGAAVAWQIDTHNVPFLNELITNWALMTVSYPLLALLIIRAVKDDNEVEEKSKDGGTIPGIH
ncbi:hypothetical protein DH2020_047766 [Rehmannia glutinosa]|uniref:UNC93-like protein n=1 Tax=Rehmannia glutinosa TaxID=99300 RepID=A0ABR0U866_REHGL